MTLSSPGSPGTQGPVGTGIALPGDLRESRIFSLDVLRGIALLGILIVSIWEFGGFTTNKQTFFRAGTHGGNYNLLSFVSIVFEGKMRALFALVFGAGIILFMTKKDHPTQEYVPDLYIKRNMWLILFGVFNAIVLLWPGDILFHYAILGILLFGFWRIAPRGLLIASIIATLIYCGKIYWNYSDDKKAYKKFLAVKDVEKKFEKDSIAKFKRDSVLGVNRKDSLARLNVKDTVKISKDSLVKPVKTDTLTKEQKKDKEAWEGTTKRIKYDSTADKNENKAMRSTKYTKIWAHLLGRSQYKESYWLYQTGLWDIGSVMLLGMALLGFGFFWRSYPSQRYLLIAIPCILIGWFLGWYRNHNLDVRVADYAKYIDRHSLPYNFFYPIERILLALGYAALVMSLMRINFLSRVWNTLAKVGRMAFTNYFLQTIICTLFFYGYGMGYFGRLTQVQLYLMVLEIWLILTVFSVLWLRAFHMGPIEWLWRYLIYKKKLPFRKNPPTTPITTTSTVIPD
ncbi:MAG: DUF418 domain-containing protein [Chitinophagaceae bacterium]|nr:DUF418 domain-containing protein [Chitinophagaceae bacterium]